MQDENRNSGPSRDDEEVPLIMDSPDSGEETFRLADEEDDGFRLKEDNDAPPIRLSEEDKGGAIRLTEDDEEGDGEPISLVDDESETGPSKVKLAQRGALEHHKREFRRALNVDGQGATRCRIFHSRIAVDALEGTEDRINEWIDSDNIEIKHVGHVIGTMEGKTARPNIVIIVWY